MLGFEGGCLQLHDDVTLQSHVMEKSGDEELIARCFQAKLPSDKREARTQFQQKTGDVTNQPALHFALMCVVAQVEKIKQVRIFQRLLSQRRFSRRQSCFKVGYGTALSLRGSIG